MEPAYEAVDSCGAARFLSAGEPSRDPSEGACEPRGDKWIAEASTLPAENTRSNPAWGADAVTNGFEQSRYIVHVLSILTFSAYPAGAR